MTIIIRDTDFSAMAKNIKPDSKKRVVLPKALVKEDVVYHVYINSFGQIVLDPQVTIPASELWLFENKETLDSVDKGMAESLNGQATKRGSFRKYVKNAA